MAQRVSVTDSATRQSLSSVWIGLLGPLTINKDGQIIELSGPKRRALLTLLSLHIDDPIGREQIIEALWPRRQTGREDSTLRVHISHLRDELETDREGNPKVLLTRGQAYMLSSHVVDTDIRRFDELVREARQHIQENPGLALELLDEALMLWRGPALQDVEYEEFAQDEIRRLDRTRIGAIRDRAEAMIAVGEDAAAIQDLEPLVRDDPTDEGAVALLMRALYRTGRQSEALSVASRLTRKLRDRGLEPSPRVALLEERIINHDPGLLPEGTLAPGEIKPGRSVRGYELREETGRGSIGVVYRAFQPAVGREVAVKVINPDLAQSSDFVRRFAEEAKVIASLEHPHIVPLHDFWREPGGAFLVMRWMDGGSLADRLGAAWEEHRLARVFDQVAAALGYAHSCGVVHRDVKPENILFDGDDNAYLCDFGLATAGIETGSRVTRTAEPPYAAPEAFRDEGPTVASDIFGLGVLLAETASGVGFPDAKGRLADRIWEVVSIASATNPADRYPDVAAFRTALGEAIGDTPSPAPKTVRRNPYKGLEPFDEIDNADFYGRDDVVEALLDAVASKGLVALIGASGSGKSSVVKAGLIPQLRDGALPGSEEWSVMTMVPGLDPFEEFRLTLRDAAIGSGDAASDGRSQELREEFLTALDGPNSQALLVVDQFEELFSSSVDEVTRERFLDNLVDLAADPMGRFRVVLTMRADFSDHPLSHPTFGEMIASSSLLLAPMRPDQLEEVIRRPASRVGVQVEPGLISEIIRDVADAPAYLPLLQYVLAELFERRSEDRLTIQAYRSLGGVQGVLERTAEATFAALDEDAKAACRQLFLRMVHLGDHGEETRRRLPLNEMTGLGGRAATEAALEAFSSARLLTYDRDPVSRTPTVEVAHETVIERWTRYRIWIDEARSDLVAQRRISAAANTWEQSGEDPAYLLTGGPLTTAIDVVDNQRVDLNELETRFVEESRKAVRAAEEREARRRQHEADLEQRSRRRLGMGVGSGLIAVVVALLALVAWNQSQRANDLAAVQSQENLARELAAASEASLISADHDLSLLLAIAAAEETVNAGEEILPEAVEALHRAVINPRPSLIIDGAIEDSPAGEGVSYNGDGTALAYVTEDGGVSIVDPVTGSERVGAERVDPPAFGVDFHPEENRVLSIHRDGVREWDGSTDSSAPLIQHADRVSTATYSDDGELVAIGDYRGTITIHGPEGVVATLENGHDGRVMSVDFDPTGSRLVSAGADGQVLVWDLLSESVVLSPEITTGFCAFEAAWHPTDDQIAVTLCQPEAFSFDANTGERLNGFSSGNQRHDAMVYDSSGAFVAGAGRDGFTRLFSTGVGGAPAVELPNSGVPLRDVEFNPDFDSWELATLGIDGELQVWPIATRSELATFPTTLLFSFMDATPDGSRYIVGSNSHIFGLPQDPEVLPPVFHVIDAGSGETLTTNEAMFELGFRHKPAISDDGSMAAFAGPSGNVVVVDVDTGTSVEIPDSARWTLDLDFSSDGDLLAGAGFDGLVALWDVSTLSRIRTMAPGLKKLPGDQPLLTGIAVFEIEFVPDSDLLATAGADGSVRLWDTSTGTNWILHVFEFATWSVDVARDGSRVAAADSTGNVRLFTVDDGSEVLPRPRSLPGEVHVEFSPDGSYLAGGGPGPLVHLWDLETGEVVRRFEGAVGKPSVVFVNDGQELRAVGAEGIVRGYVLDPEALLQIARDEVDRQMTEAECQQYLGRPCDS